MIYLAWLALFWQLRALASSLSSEIEMKITLRLKKILRPFKNLRNCNSTHAEFTSTYSLVFAPNKFFPCGLDLYHLYANHMSIFVRKRLWISQDEMKLDWQDNKASNDKKITNSMEKLRVWLCIFISEENKGAVSENLKSTRIRN